MIQWFKTMSTNEYIRNVKNNHWAPFNKKLWQRNYYEHIIRNGKSYLHVSEYIKTNPLKWMDDKEHFKGVKERLEIVKKEVDKTIEQFEEGNIEAKEDLEKEVDSNLLKKQIIDKIIKQKFDEKEVGLLEERAINLLNTKINNLLASLYLDWGAEISDLAKLKNNETLYQQSFKKYEEAIALNPKSYCTFNNWGAAILGLAKLKNDKAFYQQSIEKLNKAVELGGSSYNLACAYALTKDTKNALKYLENSLIKKEMASGFVEKDEDWVEHKNDVEFIGLLRKYNN